jgi:two-component system cell cycle sensor histidine kinase/response regulator CckA
VLVVDDEEDAFVIARDLLRRRSAGRFTATWAASAAEGLRLLILGHVDVALVDYRLPDGDGLDLIARARDAGSRTPIVLLTGRALEGTDIDALNAGAIDFLDKTDLSAPALQRVVRLAVERARIAERLRHSQGLYAAVVDATADGVVVTDAGGRVVTANPSAVRILGRSVEELAAAHTASNLWQLVGEDGSAIPADEHPVRLALATGETPPRMVVGMAGPDGNRAWISLSVSALVRPGEPAPYGAVLSFADVTALRVLEDELRQAQKMEAIGRLAGGVAHDFNNLLTAISGYSELLLADLPGDDIRRADVAEISRAAGRGADLTRQLLSFGRRQMLQPRILDLNESILETRSLLTRLLGEDIALDLRLGPGAHHIRIDPWQVEQILLNLASNARDAMPAGGSLTIETSRSDADAEADVEAEAAITDAAIPAGPCIVMSVTDTGTGMDPETVAHAFEPFFTTKATGQGTGLGLASVYGSVKQSGGHVRLRSEQGRGTTIDIHLPAAAGPLTAEEAADEAADDAADGTATAPSPAGGSEGVLFVEDERSIRDLASAILVRHGYVVHAAADGVEALRISRDPAVPLDLLVTDVVLPGSDGWEVARQVTALRPGIGALFISGYADHATVRGGLLRGEIEFLPKPFRSSDLLRAVRRVLDARDEESSVPVDAPS